MDRFGKTDRVIKARVGRKFVLDLEATATAGFTWRVSRLPSVLALRKESIRPVREAIGASSRQEFTFEAIRPGVATLQLTYGQPWEPGSQQTVQISIEAIE